jgi:hypothetical protein
MTSGEQQVIEAAKALLAAMHQWRKEVVGTDQDERARRDRVMRNVAVAIRDLTGPFGDFPLTDA